MWNEEELTKQIDEYFNGITKEQLLKDLEETGCMDYLEDIDSKESKITAWYAYLKDQNKFTFNHIENGWVDGDYPLPKKPEYTNQLSWAKMKWEKKHTYLKDGKVLNCDIQEAR